jgi:hypothetical protein
MIKIDNNKIEISGTRFEIIHDLAHLIRYVGYEKKFIPKEMMQNIVETSYLPQEKIEEEAKKSIKHVKELLDRLCKAINDEDCEEKDSSDAAKDHGKDKIDIDDIFKSFLED